jgi:hypothetical protein
MRMTRIRIMQLNVEFGYQIKICYKTEGNIDSVDRSQQVYKRMKKIKTKLSVTKHRTHTHIVKFTPHAYQYVR